MKYLISENKLPKIIANYIDMTYGDLEQIYDEGSDKIEWYKEGDDPNKEYPIFELNTNGTLFIPESFVKTLSSLFGVDTEFDVLLADTWVYMFGLRPVRINLYFD